MGKIVPKSLIKFFLLDLATLHSKQERRRSALLRLWTWRPSGAKFERWLPWRVLIQIYPLFCFSANISWWFFYHFRQVCSWKFTWIIFVFLTVAFLLRDHSWFFPVITTVFFFQLNDFSLLEFWTIYVLSRPFHPFDRTRILVES